MNRFATALCLAVAITGLSTGVAQSNAADTSAPIQNSAVSEPVGNDPAAPPGLRTLDPADIASATPAAATPEAEQRWNAELQRALPGAIVGGIIGGVIAFPLGGLILSPFTVVPGAIIGAGLGLLAVGGQPLIDAYNARYSEPPATDQPSP